MFGERGWGRQGRRTPQVSEGCREYGKDACPRQRKILVGVRAGWKAHAYSVIIAGNTILFLHCRGQGLPECHGDTRQK